ncbi:MAG TPA: hypothetical protein VIV57_08095 [Anaeromyxobacter sp.]
MAAAPAPRIPALIERLTPDVVYGAFLEEALGQGRDAVEQGRVSRPDLRLARADAVVVGADRRAHRARLAWIDDGLFSSCTCGAKRCGHAAALGLLLLGEARPAEAEDDKAATSPREAERQRRVSRGASELFDIRRLEGTLDGKRALFAAAVGDDQETVELERSSMARRIATLLAGEFAASTGRASPVVPPLDPVAALRERVGDALEQVVRLADGRLVGVVRGEAPSVAADGAILLPARAAEALHPLGSASPLAGAEVLYRAPAGAGPADPLLAARRDLLALAERKRAGGGALLAAGQPAEALGLFRDAMALACRALDPRGDPGAEPAALLAAIHGHLVPGGLLRETDAAALARAGEAARAFAAVTIAPPDSLVAAIAADAGALVTRARVGAATK